MPDGFWFVASVVTGLVAASEWARRVALRGMRSPPSDLERARRARREPSASRASASRRGGARVIALRPPARKNEVVAIPQWQKDP